MTTTLDRAPAAEKPHVHGRPDEFVALGSDHSLGENLPQRLGRRLWLPMLLMALMAFPVGVVLGAVRGDEIATGGNADTIAVLGHLEPAFIFLGFASVFGAISFAIARILGAFRKGGGEVQEAAGVREVQTLRMPWTAKAFIAGMMMAMMTLLAAVVLHFVAAAAVAGGSASTLADSEQWAIWLEGARRIGVAVYLFSILLGLASIVTVLRFQSVRIGELAAERS
ncbi:MAG: hypothetical protein HYU28_03495 [Actinobacteria bacterium]|nr:hypothetical protein [Actinomycetota bacterium]